ncbi:hypothetical protein BY458DRAFT_587495 [Sporodiniella umbellata]|nr:hypothetical protein BY458DRAFT_587495 [Sporodiniella umbellata]
MLTYQLIGYTSLFLVLIRSTLGLQTAEINEDSRWPVLYYSDEPYFELFDPTENPMGYVEMVKGGLLLSSNESDLLPKARNIVTYDQTTALSRELMFMSSLATTANCRQSLDHWDCPVCEQLIPDAVVIRSFQTYPNEITGHVLRSETYKTLFIQIRGSNSNANRILWSKRALVEHPTIPNIHVHEGKENLLVHSFGGAVGSLAGVHLQLDFPTLLNRSNFKVYTIAKPRVGDYYYSKLVYDLEAPHRPSILRGYVHEGDEYWLKYYSEDQLLIKACPGPFESKSCSNASPYFSAFEHSMAFGIQQACFPVDLFSKNFTSIIHHLDLSDASTDELLSLLNFGDYREQG